MLNIAVRSLRVLKNLCIRPQIVSGAGFGTKSSEYKHINMKVTLLPALEDNYMYLLSDGVTEECAVVDPVNPEKVIEYLKNHPGHRLTTVLTTHHHWDHAGGNEKLDSLIPGLTFYGGDDRIKPDSLIKVGQGDKVKVGNLDIECLFTPCHTSGHICYYVKNDADSSDPAVFTGDTLFAAGCGRFFEGTKEQMYHALVEVLQKLPGHTSVYCGHEYTVSNLKFAKYIEPDNQDIINKLKQAEEMRLAGQATIPTTIAEEMQINPFMRVCVQSVQKVVGTSDPVEAMGALRSRKDNWKPS